MELYEQNNYTIDNIQALIDNHAEEGVHFEFKRANALSKENADNVTKTFSAFANSDGKIVVYSVTEDYCLCNQK